jgi:hypothetical protein
MSGEHRFKSYLSIPMSIFQSTRACRTDMFESRKALKTEAGPR